MKAEMIKNNMSRAIHKFGFKFKKHSPEILVVAGVIGVVTSGVMACKATLKVNEVLDETKDNIEKIHTANIKGETEAGQSYSEEDAKKDLTIVYVQTGVKLVKMYAPAVIVGALSITGIVASNRILRKRNVALAAAYATVDRGFKEYRGRVVERFGKELDRELKYNIKAKEIEVVEKDEEGNEKVVKKTVDTATVSERTSYSRIFDETCPNWEKNAEYNNMFLRQTQNYANQKLREQGFLFLNDVYEMLGFQKTQVGQILGWYYDEKDPTCNNYVDFGIDDIHNEQKRLFINGYERSIILDFNVDGDVFSLIN
jgi:hypothetical protein